MKKTIILYNPQAPYYTMPLQFLALASVINKDKYDVKIIDARIEKSVRHAHNKVKELLPSAICVGVSVITGTPIKDAIAISRIVKSYAPNIPVVWGGWHPSIFPEQCIKEGYADFCIHGQGEITFLELLEAIEGNDGFEKIMGLRYLRNNQYYENTERKFIDINNFPTYDYNLLPLNTYFKLKGKRQLDSYSSQGCPYRCAFCADPFVYNRRWSGLNSSRMLNDVMELVKVHQIEDIVFQDENFFANRNRVNDFCKGIKENNMKFTWTATSRADQIAPLDDGFLREISNANLRRLMIGAESGSQELLDFMKKDTLAEEALTSAEKLNRFGIGATFGFIVGFPEESFDETLKTLDTIKKIKMINPDFEFNIFFFTPYPGTELFNYIMSKGFHLPKSLIEWSDIDFIFYAGYWVNDSERKYIDRFKFYTKFSARSNYGGSLTSPLKKIATLRIKNDYYDFPIEKEVVNFFRYNVLRQLNW